MQLAQPEFSRWLNPILRALKELGGSAQPREVVERVAKNEAIPDDVLDQINPAGGQRFSNQVHWARFFLVGAGLIDRSKHGVWKLTDAGIQAGQLDDRAISDLIKKGREKTAPIKEVIPPYTPRSDGGALVSSAETFEPNPIVDPSESDLLPPEEDSADYRTRLLGILRTVSPAGFERLCQRLLREAGFDQVVVTGKSNDGGIDGHGILVVNPFVSFRVLFQCKRYTGSVTPSQVRDFRGAMQGRADKGLILTTGSFTIEARREANRDGAPPIELVDSEKLVELFAKLELGLRPIKSYAVDDSFFSEYL